MFGNTTAEAARYNFQRTGRARVTAADFGTRRDRARKR
jgi:hypothetical protein